MPARLRTTTALAVSALLVAAGFTALPSPAAAASGDVFYVDNRAGCSDAGPGTDPDAPLCSFERFATDPVGPGEKLLIARGTTYEGEILLTARGSAEAPAVIDAYGEGENPRFVYGGTQAIMTLQDPDHVVMRNLDIGSKTDAGKSAAHYGLRVDYRNSQGADVVFDNLDVHDNRVVGIFVRNVLDIPYTETAAQGVKIRDSHLTGNAHGVVFANQGTISGMPEVRDPDTAANRVFTDVLVENVEFIDNDNNNPDPLEVPSQIDAGCPDSLAVGSASRVTIRGNLFDGAAGCRTTAGTAALYLGGVRDVRVVNNMFVNTPYTGNPDMVAIDHEAATAEVKIAGNYFADNYGGGIEYLAIHGAKDFSTRNSVEGNVFLRNGEKPNIPYLGGGAVSQVGASIVPDAVVRDNIWHEAHGLVTAHLGGSTAKITVEDNQAIEDPSWVSFAARDFGANGSPWTYDQSAEAERAALVPTADASATLAWTAPRGGVVSIRGYAMSTGADTALTVTNGEAEIAAITATGQGTPLSLDDVAVEAGDVIRFVAAQGGGRISFTPSVSFTGAAQNDDALGEWNFSVSGDKQGWASQTGSRVSGGHLDLTLGGSTTTFIDSPKDLGIDAASASALRLRIANRSAISDLRVHVRGPGENFTAERSVGVKIDPRSVRELTEGFEEVLVDLAGVTGSAGEIAGLRVVFGAGAGDVLIDSIQFAEPGQRWDFAESEGWTYAPDLSCPSAGAAASDPVVEIDNGAGTWRKTSDIVWNFARKQAFTAPSGSLARLDLWAYKTGAPAGCLFLRVVDADGRQLFVGGIKPADITTEGGYVSFFPQLDGLDPNATYAFEVFSPYTSNSATTYGVNFADDGRYTGGEFYSVNGRGSWVGAEVGGKRSLRFITYSAETITPNDPWADAVEAQVSDGKVQGASGYEPAVLSPADLNIDASITTKVHIRMSNPDNRQTAYLLFTTEDQPLIDVPVGSWPPRVEQDGRGVAFALEPGAGMREYVIDMSHVDSWAGTVDQLIIQPTYRWNYRLGALSSSWHGAIDRVWLDGDATTATAVDAVAPTVSVKEGTEFTVGGDGRYRSVSFKIEDAGLVDRVEINGVVKDLENDEWSDVNFVAPGAFGAVEGANSMVVFDAAGNETTVAFVLDATGPIVTVKEGAEFTAGGDDGFERVSYKLHDEGLVDRVEINGAVKDLSDNVWSDVNSLAPGVFGAVAGANTLVAYDRLGNATTVEFELAG